MRKIGGEQFQIGTVIALGPDSIGRGYGMSIGLKGSSFGGFLTETGVAAKEMNRDEG
jgi:hypothetical protein